MRLITSLVVISVVWLVHADEPPDPIVEERGKLDGTWVVDSVERDGKPDDKANHEKLILTKDSALTVKTKNRDFAGSYRIDPKAKVKTIDMQLNDDGYNIPGIYELDGDQLKICLPTTEGPQTRPDAFKTAAGSNRVLLVLKREKKS